MKATQLSATIARMINANQPVMIWGPPGGGKSDITQQTTAALERKLFDLRVALLDPVDLRGVPSVVKGVTHWNRPEFLPNGCGPSVLFLDELPQGTLDVQSACFQLVRDRRLGDYTLPDDCAILAAGNRMEDKSNTKRMPAALSNRFVHLDLDVDHDDWTKWALQNDVAQPVIGYVRFRPDNLNAFDPKERATATPRSWEFVSNIYKTNPPPETELAEYAGAVGETFAAEFVAFLRIWRNLPNLDGILQAPKKAKLPDHETPDGIATLYAVCVGLAHKATEKNFARLVQYAERMPEEFNVLTITSSVQRNDEVCNSEAYIKWCSDHHDVMV